MQAELGVTPLKFLERTIMQRVFVLDKNKQPLMPCHPARARFFLSTGKAAVFRRYPFTIILQERAGGDTQVMALKLDPGATTTGLALAAERLREKYIVWAAELTHRGTVIRDALLARRVLRRTRRHRKTRYRQPRFSNRRQAKGTLRPSLQSRVANTMTWVTRLCRIAPITAMSVELVKFDTHRMQKPEITGVEYRQGTLFGYEVREYLLEKWGRTCVYCGIKDVPLQVEHIVPKSRGGTNRISNLTLACELCNQTKGNRTAIEFGYPDVQSKAQQSLKDVAVVNTTRWALWRCLQATGLPLEVGVGARTKYNRRRKGYPKAHWIDAACVGQSGESVVIASNHGPLLIKATGHGRRQRCRTDKYGFPKAHAPREKTYAGFQTGDIVKATVPTGKFAGIWIGRIAIRHRLWFRMLHFDVHPKRLTIIQRADGYEYTQGKILSTLSNQP